MYDANQLTYTIDLDFVNIESIQNYISILNLVIDIEKKKIEELKKKDGKKTSKTSSPKVVFSDDEYIDDESKDDESNSELSKLTREQLFQMCNERNIKTIKKDTKTNLIKKLS